MKMFTVQECDGTTGEIYRMSGRGNTKWTFAQRGDAEIMSDYLGRQSEYNCICIVPLEEYTADPEDIFAPCPAEVLVEVQAKLEGLVEPN
jgi:hypothetical protein